MIRYVIECDGMYFAIGRDEDSHACVKWVNDIKDAWNTDYRPYCENWQYTLNHDGNECKIVEINDE